MKKYTVRYKANGKGNYTMDVMARCNSDAEYKAQFFAEEEWGIDYEITITGSQLA